jgi:hypothetical protein
MTVRRFFCPAVFLLCAGMMLAQNTPPTTYPPSQNRPMRRGGQEPCWQQAGIEKSVMDQVRTVAHDARSQVESVCSNSSLTPQQRQQQARQIREQAMQKRDSLLSADQRKSLMACQQERGGHPGGGGPHEGMGGGMGGGCGEMPHNGSRPGGPTGNGGGNPPQPNQSSPQN